MNPEKSHSASDVMCTRCRNNLAVNVRHSQKRRCAECAQRDAEEAAVERRRKEEAEERRKELWEEQKIRMAEERAEAEVVAIHRALGICQACGISDALLFAAPTYRAAVSACGLDYTDPGDFKALCNICYKVFEALYGD